MTLVRAIWSIVVICLVAATGVQPLRAAADDHHGEHAQLGDPHPALLAVTATQPSTARVAPRTIKPRPRLPVFVVAAPPVTLRLTAHAIAGAAHHALHRDSALVPVRFARGPPAR